MGLAFVPDFSQAAFCCLIAPDSDVTDHLRLPHLLKRKNSYNNSEKYLKVLVYVQIFTKDCWIFFQWKNLVWQESDLSALRNFILTKKPHVIVVGGESRDAIMVKVDLTDIINQLVEDEQFPRIPVEIIDNHLPKIYANSNKGIVSIINHC